MISLTDIPQTTFWDKLFELKQDLLLKGTTTKLLESIKRDDNLIIRSPDSNVTREHVMKLIEDLIMEFLVDLGNNKFPSFTLNKRGCQSNTTYIEGIGLKMMNGISFHEISLEKRNSLHKYGVTISCLSQCYTLLQTNQFSTKRDIFYSNVHFFKSQCVVDEAISNLCCLLRVPRYSLHMLSSSKGFVAGDLSFNDGDGNQFICGDTGIQIPNHVEVICLVKSKAKYILVVEKEASYTRLVESKFNSKVGPSIILTGKGYPDVNTRMLLKKLSDDLKIPVFALVDSDPHGIDIMCVYKFGSRSLSYEASNLTCPSMKWIGILPSDIDLLGLSEKVLIPMTDSDKKKCQELLKRPYIKKHDEILQQIQLLVVLDKKAEIECLDSLSRTFMTDIYLPQKIRNGDWI